MNRLKAFREIERITQSEMSERLGLSTAMISAIESGRRTFAGSLDTIGYGDDRLVLPDMSEPLHRTRAATSVASKKRAKELIRLAGEVFRELQAATPQAPASNLQRLAAPTSVDTVEDLAAEVRSLLDREESGPIQNLTDAAERAGICLIPIFGLDGVDGLSSWVEGVPVIGLNPAVPGDRIRFSLAHEIGHLAMHTSRHDHVESEANRFAGAMLFPRADFDAAMVDKPNMRHFVSLKASWGVSVAALIYRAHELDYIDDSRYRSLQIQMSKWRRNEPGGFRAMHGTLLSWLVRSNGGTTEVAKNFGFNRNHVAELQDWRHLRAA
ncbi:ImmA/IrrE family metallo-endopeptidase [Rhodococcoides fascians A25f]|uniref:ImmA/IrrE family metallo-endopeptidase n=1 Tax=Rhodococcoides fascians TaxID=1828 RepID=UPI00055FC033|nr:ImmA/IrrE family metallo-endopeptidase [Rhodococcus fascians]QII04383.1 ImmA/IrrE family metallo-endopeptidase [Rhodococcus fascians A25f]